MTPSRGSGGTDFLFFIGILLVIFAVWVSAGGPNNPISFQGPYLNPITTTGTTADAYGDPNSFSPIGTTVTGDSTHTGAVTFSRNISGTTTQDPRQEHVSIQLGFSASEGVSLAGWKLRSSESGMEIALPAAVLLPNPGRVNQSAPVTLMPGEQAIIVSGRSPVGISFKENICSGYFEEHQDFAPSLNLYCPTGYQEYSRAGGDDSECEFYVRSVPQCATRTRVPSELSDSCEDFVEQGLTYDGCAARHHMEAGFYGDTWRLFLGSGNELWKREHETILLIDAQGKTVDALSY